MGDKSLIAKFSSAIERAYTEKPKPADRQEDFDRWYPTFASADYNTAIQIIVGVKDAPVLNDLRDAYVKLYFKYATNKLNVHFARSDQIFFELFDRCRQLSTKKRDLLSEWAAQLDDKNDKQAKKRFQELSQTYQSKIRALIPKPPVPVKTILDFLRDEFQKQRGYTPKSNVDLYDFDPCGDTLKAGFEGNLLALQRAWQACIPANDDISNKFFHAVLGTYRDYLAALSKQGILQLLQVIKYLQDRIFLRRENMRSWTRISGGDTDPLTCELYATACIQLLKFAQGNLVLKSNRDSFTPEERAYFLAPLRNPKREYVYYSNIEDRFTRPLRDVPATFKLTDSFLDVMLLTRSELAGTSLVPLAEMLRVRNRWKVFEALGEKAMKLDANAVAQILAEPENKKALDEFAELLAIEVPIGNKELGRATARVGASPGVHKAYGKVTIIHIDPKNAKRNDFYVEFEALKPGLFLVHTDYITEKVYGSRVYEVHLSTVGITHVIEFMFMMMGFMPVLVEAGFAGLIQEILIAYASGKAEDVAAEINPTLGKVVGFAVQIVAPRKNFARKIVEPPPTTVPERPNIFEVKAGRATDSTGAKQVNPDWLNRSIESPSSRVPERPNIVEAKAGQAIDSTGAKQVNTDWLNRSVESPSSKVPELPQALEVKASKATDVASPTIGPPHRGEPPRPNWQEQRPQQQLTKKPPSNEFQGYIGDEAKPAVASKSVAKPGGESVKASDLPGARHPLNENRSQELVIEEAVNEVATLEEAQIAADEGEMVMAAKGKGGSRSRASIGRSKVTNSQARGTSKAARGSAGRGTPERIKLDQSAMRRLKITKPMQGLVIRVAEYYRAAMKRLERSMPDITKRSTKAHELTRQHMIENVPHVIRGKQITGVTDLVVRESDVAVHNPRWGRMVIELKAWAHVGKGGALRTTGGGYQEATRPLRPGDLEAVSSPQIQCYEVMMDEGIPVFVISGDGRIYTRDSSLDAWVQVDE
ncbi:MAG: hypothetical protein LAO18_10015 [Acidobacteriia bacterium]|nr:hypothetical protein [Terriglobia bacterium]